MEISDVKTEFPTILDFKITLTSRNKDQVKSGNSIIAIWPIRFGIHVLIQSLLTRSKMESVYIGQTGRNINLILKICLNHLNTFQF